MIVNERLVKIGQGARKLGINWRRLKWHLKKEDAPEPDDNGFYDVEELKAWWAEQ